MTSRPWPPELEEHTVLTPWRPLHPDTLKELEERTGIGPCEAISCIARSHETGKRELVTVFRKPEVVPAHATDARERLDEVKRAIGGRA